MPGAQTERGRPSRGGSLFLFAPAVLLTQNVCSKIRPGEEEVPVQREGSWFGMTNKALLVYARVGVQQGFVSNK
jgi:hypothetical protein